MVGRTAVAEEGWPLARPTCARPAATGPSLCKACSKVESGGRRWNDHPVVLKCGNSTTVRQGPGLAKARRTPLLAQRQVQLVKLRDGWMTLVLDQADIISEGDVVPDGVAQDGNELASSMYFGSTSLRCALDPQSLRRQGLDPYQLAQAVLCDPHARLRLLRIARREAMSRAGGSLDVVYAELSGTALCLEDAIELAFDVDLNAKLARVRGG